MRELFIKMKMYSISLLLCFFYEETLSIIALAAFICNPFLLALNKKKHKIKDKLNFEKHITKIRTAITPPIPTSKRICQN